MPALDLNTLRLESGAHTPGEAMCVMEAVAYVAGEGWTDSPVCASPVLSAYLRNLNDTLPADMRQRLKPLVPLIVGTNTGPEDEQRRGLMAVDWIVRVYTPAWLDLAKLHKRAADLRSLPEIVSWGSLVEATSTLRSTATGAKGEG